MKCVTCKKWRPCISVSRFREVLRSMDGMPLNSAAIGRRLDLSRTTAMAWVRAYERARQVRLLPSCDQSRRPLLLLEPGWEDDRTDFGRTQLIQVVLELLPESRLFWWKAGRVKVVHLIVETSGERIGFCLSDSPIPRRKEWIPLVIALRRGVIHRGFLLHADTTAFFRERWIIALPLVSFLGEPKEWILYRRTRDMARDAVSRINRERLAAWAGHR